MQRTRARRRASRIDRVVLAVVRLAHDEPWSDLDAASALRRQGHDETALTLARARVVAAAADRRGVYGERAIATLNAALAPAAGEAGSST